MNDAPFFRNILLLFIGLLIGHGIYKAGYSSGQSNQKAIDELQKENERLNNIRIFQFCPGETDNPPPPPKKNDTLLSL